MSPQWSIERVVLRVGGRDRSLTVVRPAVAGGGLLIAFHGSDQSGDRFREFSGGVFDAFAADGVTVAYPDGHRGHFNDARLGVDFPARRDDVDDVGFTEAVIDHVGATRVHVVGYSNGGSMVIRLVHQLGSRLAGATAIAATQPAPENLLPMDAPVVPVPVLLFHGTEDRLVPYAGGLNSLWGSEPRGLGRSARETAAYFAARNGITTEPTTTLVAEAGADRTGTERLDYRQPGHEPVTLFTVHGGGHVIPGPVKAPLFLGRTTRRVSVVEEMRDFFRLG
ncbi:hypothetical protein L6E12_33965 [Actinokineospora sp. PR83]|uniref:alpha/beta hydrolase family esterase n=1 Tax=Actinokineospora sp. PR83 TaxID=2884908 RepID=UPI0027DECD6A|nr:hypothetical protein [Actinokineospora sp. PR83]MCG8920775.1 hypothetical protein [Actinokineospora sp. PR83]